MELLLLTFKNTRDVIMAERTVVGAGYTCEAIPFPREVSSNCGIALKILKQDEKVILSLLSKSDSNLRVTPAPYPV